MWAILLRLNVLCTRDKCPSQPISISITRTTATLPVSHNLSVDNISLNMTYCLQAEFLATNLWHKYVIVFYSFVNLRNNSCAYPIKRKHSSYCFYRWQYATKGFRCRKVCFINVPQLQGSSPEKYRQMNCVYPCRRVTSHYLDQCWPSFLAWHGVHNRQCVDIFFKPFNFF